MAQCPQCFGSIEINESHYGTLFTCPHCQAVYFIDWNGNPETSPGASQEIAAVPPITTTTPEAEPAPLEEAPMAVPWNFANPVAEDPPVDPVEPMTSSFPASAAASSEELLMTYDITIEGLDIKSVWIPVRDTLLEPRLKLDVQALEKNITQGKLELKNLNPLVVFYIVQKIKSFNVSIQWRKHGE